MMHINPKETKVPIREINFNLFEARYGERPHIDVNEDDKYDIGTAKNGEAVLFIRGQSGDKKLRMNSSYSPLYEATRWASRFEVINRSTMIAALGFSTGVFLRALIRKMRPDTNFYIYEPDEGLFSFVCKYLDITDLINNPKVNLFITEKQHSVMAQSLLWNMSECRPESLGIVTPYYAENKEFLNICDSMRIYGVTIRNYQRERGRNALLSRMYAWNHMWKSSSVVDFSKKLPKDIPAVIVSAGPSLLKNVETLKLLKGHALIICTDRALSVLDKCKIEPDLIASVDAEKSSSYLRVDVSKDKKVLCTYDLNKESQKMFGGRCVFYCGYDWENELFGDKSDNGKGFDHGGNVSGSTFTICRLMGIKTIVLIGQDLAYLNGMHHADNIEDGVPQTETRQIEGIDGGLVESCDMWINFRNFFERQISLYPDLEVIDATEGGALIQGSKVMTLNEVVKIFSKKTYELKDVLDGIPYVQTKREYEVTLEKMNHWIDELELIENNAKELSIICSQLLKVSKYNDIKDNKNENKLKRMNHLRNEIDLTQVNSMLEHFWVRDIYSIPDKNLMLRTKEEAIQAFETAAKYYKQLPNDCQSLKRAISAAMEEGIRDSAKIG